MHNIMIAAALKNLADITGLTKLQSVFDDNGYT
jgi:hypothetical protein